MLIKHRSGAVGQDFRQSSVPVVKKKEGGDEDENEEDIEMLAEEGKNGVDDSILEDQLVQIPESGVRRGWRRVREYYTRSKQYIFVAATLPVNGKRTAGGVLKRMFPDASWVSGVYLHRHNPR